MKAIIVEDDSSVAALFKSWFEAIGFEAFTAPSRVEADALLALDPPPQVITVDINLLDIRGEETFAWVEQLRKQFPDALLMVISGVLKPTDAPLLAKLGADAAIEKMDVTLEKTWWGRMLDAIKGVTNQQPINRNLAHIQELATLATNRANTLGVSLGMPVAKVEEAKPIS